MIVQHLPVFSPNTARGTHVLREVTAAGESVEVEATLLHGAAPVAPEHPGPAGVVELAALQGGRVPPVSPAPARRGQAARRWSVVGQLTRTLVFVKNSTRRAGALPGNHVSLAGEGSLAVGGEVGVLTIGSFHAWVGLLAAWCGHVRHGKLTLLGTRIERTEVTFVIFLQKRLLALVVQRTSPIGICIQPVFQSTAQRQAETEAGASVSGAASAWWGNTCIGRKQELF